MGKTKSEVETWYEMEQQAQLELQQKEHEYQMRMIEIQNMHNEISMYTELLNLTCFALHIHNKYKNETNRL
jgi:hypothetical protein